jgi:hypothetical protein
MKEFEKIPEYFLKRENTKPLGLGSPKPNKKKLKKASELLKLQERLYNPPKAPYNTTQYIMKQHKSINFDPQDLLGTYLGLKSN